MTCQTLELKTAFLLLHTDGQTASVFVAAPRTKNERQENFTSNVGETSGLCMCLLTKHRYKKSLDSPRLIELVARSQVKRRLFLCGRWHEVVGKMDQPPRCCWIDCLATMMPLPRLNHFQGLIQKGGVCQG